MRVLSPVGAFVILLANAGHAHDFWIEPSVFRPEVGKRFSVALRVGDHFQGEPVARDAKRIVKFIVADEKGEKPIVGRDGEDPAGLCRLTESGTYTLGYRSNHAFVELEPQKFEDYLKEKGLESIIQARTERGERQEKAREAYSRCSKALIRVGDAGGPLRDRTLGFTLEVTADAELSAASREKGAAFRVVYDGKPLENALLTATRRGHSDEKLSGRTDREGRVSFTLAEGGVWLIAVVHMVRGPEKADYEWESYWASLTFELAPAAKPSVEPVQTLGR